MQKDLSSSLQSFVDGIDKQIRATFAQKSFSQKNSTDFFTSQPGYFLDLNGEIVGLNFCELELDDDGFMSLSISIGKYAPKLKYLLLSGNAITNASPVLSLTQIEYLDLSWNKLRSIDCLGSCSHLRVLLASHNEIAEVDTSKFSSGVLFKWQNDFHETGFYLVGNPLVQPPKEAFIDNVLSSRFTNLAKGSAKETREMRIILIGSGGAGKTSLSKKIQDKPMDHNEPTTKHIAISQAQFASTTTQIWDFAGQDSMMSVHRFFLAERSMYLLVLDCRREEHADYLLDYIRSFAPQAPIYVVLNKIDENQFHDLDRARIVRDFPQVAGFFRTSCARGTGIDELVSELEKAIALDERAVLTLPAEWQEARVAAQELVETYMDIEDFREICIQKGLPEADFSAFLEFAENVGFLYNVDVASMHLVYSPRWLVSVVYPLLSPEELIAAGAIDEGARDSTLNKRRLRGCVASLYKSVVTKVKHRDVLLAIDVMEKRELCVTRGGEAVYIPDLLPNDSEDVPREFAHPQVKVVWQYQVLPRYLMHRVHVRFSPFVDSYKHWQTGLLIKDDTFECQGWIDMDEREQTISVSVIGKDYKPFIKTIRKRINDLNEELFFEDVVELFDVGNGTMVELSELEGLLEIPVEMYHSGKLKASIRISDILDSFSVEIGDDSHNAAQEQRLQLLEAGQS